MNKTRYVTILDFMISELHLKGVELILYAIIYGYSQGSYGEYWGGMDDMQHWTQATRRGVQKALEKLAERGLIKKDLKQEGRVRRAVFCLNDGANLVRPESYDGANSVPLRSELSSVTERTEFAHPNDIKTDIETDKEISAAKLASICEEFKIIWDVYPRKEGRKESEAAYARSRKRGISLERILNGTKAYADECRAEKRERRYIKQGSTFFRGEYWDTERDSGGDEKNYGETGAAEW